MSSPLPAELRRVLSYPKLAPVLTEPEAVVRLVAEASFMVDPAERLTVVDDEADNRILEAAVAGGASVIVTGDRKLRALGAFRGIAILEPAAAVRDLLEPGAV